MPELTAGTQFGKYQIVSEIGRGGMAVVYKARQPSLDRFVALKVLADHLLGDPDFVRRFQGEARTAAKLEHPNIVPIHEVDEAQGVPFIAMRFIEGESLAAHVARTGPMPFAQAVSLLSQIGSALDFAHSKDVVHRDIKPANILIDPEGRAYLMDFGIARAGDQSRFTRIRPSPSHLRRGYRRQRGQTTTGLPGGGDRF